MNSECCRYTLVFNGEIYNHWDVREELLAKGYEFISKSDTETLLYAYIEFGEEIFKKLNGIFAFALFGRHEDGLQQTWHLCSL